jgi:hypothetical protein
MLNRFSDLEKNLRIFTRFVSQVSQTIDDELVVRGSGEFSFEQWPDACPSFLCRRDFQMAYR